ncbi:hypothetical protein AMTR_s00098p00158050 [Amborella trichopoda]|uniref:Uncharacterized protein n=1 Tax=Amborella trichopoda TaxID=13333 RepID=W1NYU8_AMBTC|nr:hypothetical protein AMTR_s00098p00158050 [Amborella trichopoda]
MQEALDHGISSQYPFGKGKKKHATAFSLYWSDWELLCLNSLFERKCDPLALVVLDPIEDEKPSRLQMNQEQLDGEEGFFDPNSSMVEGEVGEPIASMAEDVQPTLLLSYFSIYE